MSPILSVNSIVIISKVVTSNATISIVTVSCILEQSERLCTANREEEKSYITLTL
jgi:hypothetical protein